jgi:subtilisin family serine protease
MSRNPLLRSSTAILNTAISVTGQWWQELSIWLPLQRRILPLKAFHSDGTGYTSDILRAIYYAIIQHANVVNMSFTLPGYSREVATALDMATGTGMILVAAAGNNGQPTMASQQWPILRRSGT